MEVGEVALRGLDAPVLATLDRLRGLGVRLPLRRFGADGGRLTCLRRLPFDTLKLDPELLAPPRPGRRDGPLLRAVVDLALDLDMAVAAEGVETGEQVARLEGAGCDRARGAFLAAPQPAAGFKRLLHRLAPAAPSPRPLASAL